MLFFSKFRSWRCQHQIIAILREPGGENQPQVKK